MIALAPRYKPSITPKTSGDRFRLSTRYNGRMAVTISAEMSVRRLVRPRKNTVRLTRVDASFFRTEKTWLELSTWYTGQLSTGIGGCHCELWSRDASVPCALT